MKRLRVMVVGSAGRMGQQVVRAVCAQDDMELVAAVDQVRVGEDAARLAGLDTDSVPIRDSLSDALAASPDAAVDFTLPASVAGNVQVLLAAKVPCVVGTSGLREDHLERIAALCKEHDTPAFVAPNFAIGAVLLMEFAGLAARHFDAAEIIELHHSGKEDAPSGTAENTAARMLRAARGSLDETAAPDPRPARGEARGRIRIHSVRLPGLVAHQEVIFGGLGQTLCIRHDSTSRESFMPGVLMAIRKVRSLSGLVVGLENLL